MEMFRQEFWNGLPFPTPGDLPHPGIEPVSLASPVLAGEFFITGPPGKSGIDRPVSSAALEGARKRIYVTCNLSLSPTFIFQQQLQAYVAWVNAQLKKRPAVKPVQDLRQDLRDGVILAYLIEIVGQLALDSDARLKQNMAFLPSMCPSEQIVGGGLVTKSCPTLVTPWTVAHQAPLSMRFPRQEYWSGLPFCYIKLWECDEEHGHSSQESPNLVGKTGERSHFQ